MSSRLLDDIEEGIPRSDVAHYDNSLMNLLKKGSLSPYSNSDFVAKIVTQNLVKSAEYLFDQMTVKEYEKIQLEKCDWRKI